MVVTQSMPSTELQSVAPSRGVLLNQSDTRKLTVPSAELAGVVVESVESSPQAPRRANPTATRADRMRFKRFLSGCRSERAL